jgi:hypothetical protein
MKKEHAGVAAAMVFLLCTWHSEASGATVKAMNLEEICKMAGTIFSGVCTQVATVHEPAIQGDVLVYTFEADRILKGRQSESVVIRMHRRLAVYARAPKFEVGEKVVLFLYPASDLGFTSPVGFGQGKFYIIESTDGGRTVVNENQNENLFRGMVESQRAARAVKPERIRSLQEKGSGPIGYEEFMGLVELLVE